MSDLEFESEGFEEVSKSHSKLVEAVRQLDKGQRVKRPERSEPSLQVSEFHLVKSGVSDNDAIDVKDLTKALGQKGRHAEITQKLQKAQKKSTVLPKPLEKPAAERIKRTLGFEKTKDELSRWDAIVARNRTAERIRFPLKQPSMRWQPSNEFVKRFRIKSELEEKLEALQPKKPVVEVEDDEFPTTLEEVIERRKETARLRAQQSYREAKAHRQNKIKSKKFHRIQRKEKIKKEMKEFEELQKTDPQAALEKLEQLDRSRAEERMSLRHKSTGQWAKNKQVRAKYDTESRKVLAQQLSISKELTQKVRKDDDSDEEENYSEAVDVSTLDKENPWINGVKTEEDINEFIGKYRKYWDERNKLEKETKKQSPEADATELKKNGTDKLANGIKKPSNPVIQVIEEPEFSADEIEKSNWTETEIERENKTGSSSDESEISNDKSKFQNGLQKKNLKKSKKRDFNAIATGSWDVSPVEDNETKETESKKMKSKDIDDIFDEMEENIQNRIKTTLQRIKSKPTQKNVVKKSAKKRNSNKDDNANEYSGDLGLKNARLKPKIDAPLVETIDDFLDADSEVAPISKITTHAPKKTTESSSKVAEIDPTKFLNVKPQHIKTQLPDEITGGTEGLDDSDSEEERHAVISEAFADDDVVEDFKKEKEEEIKKSQPEDIDLSMPGWGSWGGTDAKVSARKRKRFIVKLPKDAPRKDENKGDVVIIEENDAPIRKHQVNELPFPFTTVKDFEASIRAPIGRTFVPENIHRRLIQPAVQTAMGQVIEPMDEDALLNLRNAKKNKNNKPKANKSTVASKKGKILKKGAKKKQKKNKDV